MADRERKREPEPRADAPRADGEIEARSAGPDGPEGLLTLVCLTCGNEKYFDRSPPDRIVCDKCGGTVFRNFFTPTERDDATLDQLESTARSIALDEESPETTADEIRDLNNP